MQVDSFTDLGTFLGELTAHIINGGAVTHGQAQRIVALHAQEEILQLMSHAMRLRKFFKGETVDLCAVVNAQSGRCSEDCIFCAQSKHHKTDIKIYSLLDTPAVLRNAQDARHNGAHHFGIVASGKGITGDKELESVCASISEITGKTELLPCASLGVLSEDQLGCLREAGLKRYHHNLETAESYFPSICSTHTFQERVQTIRAAQKEGFEICAGGIFGLGETPEQRIELAFTLRDLNVDSIPLNFLNPVAGTPAEHCAPLPPLEILKIIAFFRFVLPQRDIRVCGGREVCLRTLQPLLYLAGANGTMVGNYLTTSGRNPAIDLQEMQDLGFTPRHQ
jgi:biotin synthase